MQLILSIDNIGMKKNMSSVEHGNENEKEDKNLLNNILSISSPKNTDIKVEEEKHLSDSDEKESNGYNKDDASEKDLVDNHEGSKAMVCETDNIVYDNDKIDNIKEEIDCDENTPIEIKTENEEITKEDVNETLELNILNLTNDIIDEMCSKDVEESPEDNFNESQLNAANNSQVDDIDVSLELTVNEDEVKTENIEIDSINNTTEKVANNLLEKTNEQAVDRTNSEDVQCETICPVDDEIISIADEKDSCDSIKIKQDNENNPEKDAPLDIEISDESTELNVTLENTAETSKSVDETRILDKDDELSTISKSEKCSEVLEENKQDSDNMIEQNNENSSHHEKKLEYEEQVMNFKLSNSLNILSDDDEGTNTPKVESPKPEPEESNKQCINIEDDDDIMLIDDDCIAKENENTVANNTELNAKNINIKECNNESKEAAEVETKERNAKKENKHDVNIKHDLVNDVKDNESGLRDTKKDTEEKTKIDTSEKVEKNSPLLSTNALKSFKKSLAEMTREELEDYCILKIVEGVFDKANLGEIKSQIKVMAQNIEEYKNKTNTLSKQNRDLQLVLKSVQEEQKKNSGNVITPLKITRSVGMQVLMTEKNLRKRPSLITPQALPNPNTNDQSSITNTNNNNKNQNKSQVTPNTRNAKAQQTIPVPRLIPAMNNATKPSPNTAPQTVNSPGKSPTVNNIPNGIKNSSPAAKPEKRTHSKMQTSNSVTVDLTDDEPPAKMNNRSFNSSVRCVPPQTLLSAQRPPLTQSLNSPKRVYIPISGPQNQVRPGQTIVLKSVPFQAPRPRGPSKIGASNTGAVKNSKVLQRHPAPLPDFMKQYQPPNWKALPPAPELKLAKVENGIVISWKIDGYREENYEEIASYQLFAYQETSSPPNTSLWKKIGDVKALPLPMACTLTQFMSGYKYYFAVRAVDIRSRFGPFSLPGSILLLKN